MKLALIGLAMGLMAALTLTRLISSVLFEVKPNDPYTFSVVALLLLGSALLSGGWEVSGPAKFGAVAAGNLGGAMENAGRPKLESFAPE